MSAPAFILTPATGPTSGGNSVTITGANLSGTSAVFFGDKAATAFTQMSPTQLIAVAPAGVVGVVDVSLTTAGGTSTDLGAYAYLAAPTITSFMPAAGQTAGGNIITINGSGFSTATSVSFGDSQTTPTVVNDTQLVAVVPAGAAAGAVTLSVTTAGGSVAVANAYQYVDAPTLVGLSPTAGPATGGNAVTILGTDFNTTSAVTFGGTPASFTVVSSTQIVALAPAGSPGSVDVTVSTAGGSATASEAYTYVAAPDIILSPSTGPTAGGNPVTITGVNLSGTLAVYFGANRATITANTPTMVSVIAPASSQGVVNVSLTTAGGTVTKLGVYAYLAAPTVDSLSSTAGPTAGGNSITITGSGFSTTTSVSFGANSAEFTIINDTQLVAFVPAGVVGGAFNVSVTTAGGTTTGANPYQYVDTPTIAAVSPTAGPITGGNLVTITGSNFNTASLVTFGGVPAAFSVIDPYEIVATAPASGDPGTVDVTVSTVGGSATASAAYTYMGAPGFVLSPAYGTTAGGNVVRITGTNLLNTTAVHFGDQLALSFTVVSPTQIQAVAPAGAIGVVNVSVTTAGGTATNLGAYAYVATPTIASLSSTAGPTSGGNTITIAGSGFSTASSVSFGTTQVEFTIVNDAQINVVVPAGTAAGPVNLTVQTAGGTATAILAYTYVDSPTISSVSPISGPTSGGTPVTITGTGFRTTSQVLFGGTPAPFSVIDDTQLVVIAPGASAGPADLTILTAGGSATAAGAFTYLAGPGI